MMVFYGNKKNILIFLEPVVASSIDNTSLIHLLPYFIYEANS